MVIVVNHLWTAKDLRHSDLGVKCGGATPLQQQALEKIASMVEVFLDYRAAAALPNFFHDWEKVLEKIRLDYSGGEIHPAQSITWKQIEPALPPKGMAGKVRFTDLCDGVMLEVMRNPKLLMKDETEWIIPDG